ncbi:MAG: hypothetical protein CMJ40_07700 [Phycisphaerae bacterium]|nr:hypothetical protein [Phycisphaerae bacterium]|tara:strand:- start:238 stop:1056 length:819 start_codon:yes stop_codon:yes gene_type:complete
MRLLIDTFNVLHVTGVLPPGLAGPGVAGLAALIQGSRWSETPVALICDGMPPPEGPPRLPAGIRTIYSKTVEADDILERLIADSTAPTRLLVVSSDRRVRRAAKKRGAKDLEAEQFLRLLLEDRDRARHEAGNPHRPANLRPGEIESWKTEFQIEEDGLELPELDLPEELLESLRAMDPPTEPVNPKPSASNRKIDPAILIPEDILREAQELLGERIPEQEMQTPPVDETKARPSSPTPTTQKPESGSDVPASLIEEAEAMLRKWLEQGDER